MANPMREVFLLQTQIYLGERSHRAEFAIIMITHYVGDAYMFAQI